MTLSMKAMVDYIARLGPGNIPHLGTTCLAQCRGGVQVDESVGGDDAMCRAAMFHSIYGTEGFQDFTLPLNLREELRELIGDRAERIVYANYPMDRTSFFALVEQEQDCYRIVDRLSSENIDLANEEFENLMQLHLCDFLE